MKIKSLAILAIMILAFSVFSAKEALPAAEGLFEPLAVNTRNVPYYHIYNNQLQVATRLDARGMIDNVTAFRKLLFNGA